VWLRSFNESHIATEEKFTSGAEALVDAIGLYAGDESRAYRSIEFFRGLTMHSCGMASLAERAWKAGWTQGKARRRVT
jgi:hypothetical protein